MNLGQIHKDKARTAREEYEYLRERLDTVGNFFPWDVHPNKVRAASKLYARLLRKIANIIDSEEYKE